MAPYVQQRMEMARQSAEQELVALEKRYWRAMEDSDVETAVSLTDFPCIVAGSGGVRRVDERAYREMISSPAYQVKQFTMKGEMQARMLSDDVGIVAYEIHEELDVHGNPVTVDATDASTWVKRDGRWRCALHTESIAGDALQHD
jgi:Domain of unknown function (DUF4440)